MDLIKSYDFFKPSMCKGRTHIIGCGSVGSTLAELIARTGYTKFSLYDFDNIEAHNLANQPFRNSHIGRNKAEVTAEMICEINPEAAKDIRVFKDGWSDQPLSGCVFLCVDSMKVRNAISRGNASNRSIKTMFDFRTRLTDAQHYAADWNNPEQVSNFIKSMDFTDEDAHKETPVSACGVELSVASTVRTICSYGVTNWMNFYKNGNLKVMIIADAFDYNTIAV